MKLDRALRLLLSLSAAGLALSSAQAEEAPPQRPMQFSDVLELRAAEGAAASRDGTALAYVLREPVWRRNANLADIWIAPVKGGYKEARRLTETPEIAEADLHWLPDGTGLVFSAPATGAARDRQLWYVAAAGGKPVQLTDLAGGVTDIAASKDGSWLGFVAKVDGVRQVWRLPLGPFAGDARAEQVTGHAQRIVRWAFANDGKSVLFTAPDADDAENEERIRLGYAAKRRFEPSPRNSLWRADLATRAETRLASSTEYSVESLVASDDGQWVAFQGAFDNRFQRGGTERDIYSDPYLLNLTSGTIERLANNPNIPEQRLGFTPDSRNVVFVASDNFEPSRNTRLYIRGVTGGMLRRLGEKHDGDLSVDFWSEDGKTAYFSDGKGVTEQLFALSLASGEVTQVTNVRGVVSGTRGPASRAIILRYSDPRSPADFYAATPATLANRAAWTQLTKANPQVDGIALGETEAYRWTAPDGETVEGVLVKPVGYRKGQRYPLILMIHGGPAAASTLAFSANYTTYPHVYAAAGYAVLMPNYRGSTNYGERFKLAIVGDYFGKSYPDIISGVDSLIAAGIADPDGLGSMGWSSGGTWSNWILTHTTRFKAISSGAGASDWVSFYGQNDLPATREFYHRGPPYEHFDHYWETSSIKYIAQAKTPTLIHVVDGDPRVPRPQSEELYRGLYRQGVPTELLVYPGSTHGIVEAREQMVKMVSEFNWFERWIRGKENSFAWNDLLAIHKARSASEDDKPGR